MRGSSLSSRLATGGLNDARLGALTPGRTGMTSRSAGPDPRPPRADEPRPGQGVHGPDLRAKSPCFDSDRTAQQRLVESASTTALGDEA